MEKINDGKWILVNTIMLILLVFCVATMIEKADESPLTFCNGQMI